MNVLYPDYGHSIAGIPASLLRHYGAPCEREGLPLLDEALAKGYRNVVVIVLDGLGSGVLARHLPGESFLRAHRREDISSVFPPTTTAATTTLLTGQLPIEHGWLGWSLYFEEIDDIVNVYPNTLKGKGKHAAYPVAHRHLPFETILAKIEEATGGGVRAEGVFPYEGHKPRNALQMCALIEEICSGEGRHYVHAYWPQPDGAMHTYGVDHPLVAQQVRVLDALVALLCLHMTDTLVVVTADHGMVDVSYRYLRDYPEIARRLARLPSIEARAASLFIKEGEHDAFEAAFRSALGDKFLLFTREEAMLSGLFGGGVPHPRAAGLIGDYLAVATDSLALEYMLPSTREPYKANHAGLTQQEMTVPLIVAECGKR